MIVELWEVLMVEGSGRYLGAVGGLLYCRLGAGYVDALCSNVVENMLSLYH